MTLSFRAKLMSVVVLATVVLALVLGVYAWLGLRGARDLDDVEGRMVPKLELAPRLESEFEHLRQSMQDAVAAQDPPALDASIQLRNDFIATVSSAGPALSAAEAAQLRHAITAYHEAAYGVSRRMMRGETGESLVDALAAMQAQQHSTEALVRRAARLDRRELTAGFQSVRHGITAGTRYAVILGLSGLLLVLALSSWVAGGTLRSITNLSSGMARFATSDFREPIPITTDDDLGKLTREANLMAQSLERGAWLKAGIAELSDELRGELEPKQAAERVVDCLVRRTGAVAGALLLDDGSGSLAVLAGHALPDAEESHGPRRFRRGEGLAGQAALSRELTVIDAPPAGYLGVRSGLGAAEPRALVFLPLWRGDASFGVLELALFTECSERVRELLRSVREMVAIALEVAGSRATLRDLLDKSQKQTDLLAAQEEELRASNRDLVEQQDELRRANDELELQRQALSTQNTELEEAREGLVEKAAELARVSAYKSQFLANMSHELRTPLNSMLVLSHLLSENEDGRLSAKQVDFAKTINGAGKDLLGLINQVLDLAKIEAGRQEVDLGEVVLAELVESLTRLFATSIQQKGLEFRVEVADGLPRTLVTDRQRVERILVNLLGNAQKFTERGTITLRVSRPEGPVRVPNGELAPEALVAFAVSDTGIGIAAGAHARIFAPFEQAEARTDRRYGGTGLGLSIARESALLLGGDIVLESHEGAGSTFTCYVPERPVARASRAPEPQHANGDAQARGERGNLRIDGAYLLVVEDDAVFAERLVELIHGRGFQALVAQTGADALRFVKAKKPHGMILDVTLPDIDGWTVMERLRQDPATRSIPVHFISAMDAPDRALSLGAVGFLTKPASPQETIRAIRLLTRPTTADSANILVVEDDLASGGSVVELLRSAGFTARHVTSAGAALEAIEREDVGCIVLDLGLPDMDGLGLLETLASRPGRAMPPVVVHTGRSLTREETRRIEKYAEAVVLKDGHSATRLIEEVRLFVQHLREEGPKHALAPQTKALPDVSLRGQRILVADDDMRTVYALSALLRGKGAEVLVAENGREALEVLGAHPDVSAVLMDVMMPEMDGYEALRRLRTDSRFSRLPAIALTAKAMKGERERCLAAGASEYLAKPIDPGRLLTALQGILVKPHVEQHERS